MTENAMRAAIGALVVIGFLAVLALCLLGIGHLSESQSLLMLFGSLSTAFGTVLQWYFGSSKGSEEKTALIAGMSTKDEGK